jgi:hypothetical protein
MRGTTEEVYFTNSEQLASADSLPRSLRHHARGEALDDAIDMVHTLILITESLSDDVCTDTGAVKRGVSCYMDLLLDKLEIAAGEYQFPFVGSNSDEGLAARGKS